MVAEAPVSLVIDFTHEYVSVTEAELACIQKECCDRVLQWRFLAAAAASTCSDFCLIGPAAKATFARAAIRAGCSAWHTSPCIRLSAETAPSTTKE
jgi:hypothetical protein